MSEGGGLLTGAGCSTGSGFIRSSKSLRGVDDSTVVAGGIDDEANVCGVSKERSFKPEDE